MRFQTSLGWLVVVAGLLTCGCAASSDGVSGAASTQRPSPRGGAATQVDPQVLKDVIDATYWLPGPSVRRGMRVQNFAHSIAVQECSGDPIPLGSTEDRYAQDLFPDLDLIRERGFAETGPSYRDGLSSDCSELVPDSLASWNDWYELQPEWQDLATTIQSQSTDLDNEVAAMTDCLRDRTGLTFDSSTPTANFLVAANNAGSAGATGDQMMGYAAAYAGCSGAYFAAFASDLKPEREDLVERHRETLERFAMDISAAGYVP